ncbi:MAG TPA: rhodanese-like domain-containing protein, partial [Vicinamibacteria bacterium]|nr:rhodanese-like domain-containing protein [Vicinamibacteria bacterium]
MDALAGTGWLAGRLGAPGLRVADVRWYLDPARKGREAYRAGHIPGAVFLDVDADLSAPGGGRGLPAGRHPWPSEAQVGRVMGAAGIGPGVTVVAYDDQSGAVAARLWYLLRAH